MYWIKWNTTIGSENEIHREALYAARKVFNHICKQETTESATLSVEHHGYIRPIDFYEA